MAFVYLSNGISGLFSVPSMGNAPLAASLVAGLSEAVTVHQENDPQCDGCCPLGVMAALVMLTTRRDGSSGHVPTYSTLLYGDSRGSFLCRKLKLHSSSE